MRSEKMRIQDKRLVGIMIAVGVLLSVPFVATRFTGEVNWSLFDYIAAAILLLGTGLACEFVLRKVPGTMYRLGICAVLLLALFIVWAELAVGVFGTRFAGS
jgi:hypothetical protein